MTKNTPYIYETQARQQLEAINKALTLLAEHDLDEHTGVALVEVAMKIWRAYTAQSTVCEQSDHELYVARLCYAPAIGRYGPPSFVGTWRMACAFMEGIRAERKAPGEHTHARDLYEFHFFFVGSDGQSHMRYEKAVQ